MTHQENLIHLLKTAKEFFDRSTRPLTEEHSSFRPADGMFTVAEQVAHTAQTVEWFVHGVFAPGGFDLDFEKHAREVAEVKSLAAARKMLDSAFSLAVAEMERRPWSEWDTNLPENPIMGPAPRWSMVGALVDHTAHHRGALTVYSRMLRLVPPMPYADM